MKIGFFTVPKAFLGHVGVIQRNAIASWLALESKVEVALFGNEEGVGEVARSLGLLWVPEVPTNEAGTPILSFVFNQAQISMSSPYLCYANADICFTNTLPEALDKLLKSTHIFLMAGQRMNLEIREEIAPNVLTALTNEGRLAGPEWIDYFVFKRGLVGQMPSFAVGRAGWDNWLIWRMRSLGIPVVDATGYVLALHQNHDYRHVVGGFEETRLGSEGEANRALAGGRGRLYTMEQATHRLTPKGLRLNWGHERILKDARAAWFRFLDRTRPIRHRIGLRKRHN